MTPVDVFVGTTAERDVLLVTMKLTAFTPPKRTVDVPIKFAPEMVTFVPGLTDDGEKLVMRGCAKKLVADGTT